MFNETSYTYSVTDPQEGDEITSPGDIFAEDDLDDTVMDYNFEPNDFSDCFMIGKYPDGSVNITYAGGLAGVSTATLVIEVQFHWDFELIYLSYKIFVTHFLLNRPQKPTGSHQELRLLLL